MLLFGRTTSCCNIFPLAKCRLQAPGEPVALAVTYSAVFVMHTTVLSTLLANPARVEKLPRLITLHFWGAALDHLGVITNKLNSDSKLD